jgi:hypothetical protein
MAPVWVERELALSEVTVAIRHPAPVPEGAALNTRGAASACGSARIDGKAARKAALAKMHFIFSP